MHSEKYISIAFYFYQSWQRTWIIVIFYFVISNINFSYSDFAWRWGAKNNSLGKCACWYENSEYSPSDT